MNRPAIGLHRLGRQQRSRRLVHKRHEFIRKPGHRAANADPANVRTTAKTCHPSTFRHIAVHYRSPAAKFHNALWRTVFIGKLSLLVIAAAIATFVNGLAKQPRGPTGFNARRYRWVKKQMDRFDVCPGADETVVYSIGTLYGEWIDGTPFEGNRYVDRFVVRDGFIVKMDVWNDSAERILVMRGIEA